MKKFWFKWFGNKDVKDVARVLSRGGIAVMPTDTTYGIVGSALNEKTVNEIYRLRKRDLDKPFIVLIADRKDLKKFGVKPTEAQNKILDRIWPASVSVILPCADERFAYLHRGKNTLAFRLPEKEDLRRLLREVGPLVAPSANPQGHPVAKTISDARAYFGHHARPVRGREGSQRGLDSNGVSFYQDGGTIVASPSKLIDITDGTEKVIRA
ncbi:MAG: L-threonylcarbamoyladenylate synthase [bacterium]|nr:L-threonylcarbamoyladenylate synthase [bacterium]